MAAGASPLAAILPALLAMRARAAGGGGSPMGGPGGPGGPMPGMPGMPPGGPGTGPSDTPSDMMQSAAFGRELSSQRQADPGALVKSIADAKQKILEMINQTGMSNPGVARALSKTLQGLDAASKEAMQAIATLQVAQPIQSSVAMGAPGAGGPNPAPSGVPGMGQF